MTVTVHSVEHGKPRQVLQFDDGRSLFDWYADLGAEDGGGTAPTPHELFDGALGACKALTALWWARRQGVPLAHVHVTVDRDDSQERQGVYRLKATLAFEGDGLTDEHRTQLLAVAEKCPIQKLMPKTEVQVTTALA